MNADKHFLKCFCDLTHARACLKNAFRKMCATICGRFRLNEGGVAGYVNRMKAKYTAKWGVQIAGMIFQTRSTGYLTLHFKNPVLYYDASRLSVEFPEGLSITYPH